MVLETWMIVLIILVWGYSLYDMYKRGFNYGYIEGGVYSHIYTMKVMTELVGKAEADAVQKSIIKKEFLEDGE